jgi:hypothetical protein
MKRLLLRPFAFLMMLSALVVVSLAQTAGTGAIAGTVTDPGGAVVVGAAISVIDVATGETRTAVSTSTGTYLVPLLRPATYRVEVSKSGFKVSVSVDVPVHITETVAVDLHLAVGTATETVMVTANSELLKTEGIALGQVVDEREVSSIPLVTRNYSEILGLSPGVSTEVFNAAGFGRGGDTVVVNGGNFKDNNFQMNGVEINDLEASGAFSGGVATPNPDSIQEFKVQTSQYDASYGRDAGANVNVLTKAGSNAWHGNVWEFFRNEALNANSFFNNETGQPRAILRQNQFGFTLGGPIMKSKLLFFTSYQGTRQQNGLSGNCSSSVILPVLTNDRSAAGLAAAVGPATAFGGLDPNGTLVTAANVSAQGLALFNAKLPNGQYLIPNPEIVQTDPTTGLPEGFSTYSSACPYAEDQFITNLDWLQNAKSTFQGRFFFANSQNTETLISGDVPGFPATNPQNFRNFSLSHTYAFSANLVNQAEIGFHRTFAGFVEHYPISFSDIGVSAPSFDNAIPFIAVSGGFTIGGIGQSAVYGQNTYVLEDTLSWTHGRHSLRFGGSLTRAQVNFPGLEYAGELIFLNYPGLLLGQPPYNPYITVDFPGIKSYYWRVWDGSLYAQDDIKVTKRLTVNLGFRYERLGDLGDIKGHNVGMDPSLIDRNPPDSGSLAGILVSSNFPGTLPAGVVSSGNNLAIRGLGQNTLNPRVGFVWSLPGTQRFVLRGGYGVYHEHATGVTALQQTGDQPFSLLRVVAPDTTTGFANPFPPDPGTFPQFYPYSPSTAFSPTFMDPNIRPPIYQKYSLGLQTQIARDFVLEVGYAGMRGTHMLVIRDINQASLANAANPINGQTTTTVDNIQSRALYRGFLAGNMWDIESNGFAWYNSLQASLSKRFSHGLQFLASYTFARDLANVNGSTTGWNGAGVLGDNNNPRADYGPDSFVRPHRFVFSAVYELPGPSNRHSLVGQTLGGWKLAGVTTIQSGHRLSLASSNYTNAYGAGSNGDFAEIVPGCNVSTSGSTTHRLNNWINQNCIAPYPIIGDDGVATGWGNSSIGILRGPGQFNTDLSLIKLFPLKWPNERTNVEFRTEFFNVFNHPIFGDPVSNISYGPSFGTITNTVANPRIIQFALKVNF